MCRGEAGIRKICTCSCHGGKESSEWEPRWIDDELEWETYPGEIEALEYGSALPIKPTSSGTYVDSVEHKRPISCVLISDRGFFMCEPELFAPEVIFEVNRTGLVAKAVVYDDDFTQPLQVIDHFHPTKLAVGNLFRLRFQTQQAPARQHLTTDDYDEYADQYDYY